jgi:hypothetical protein
MAETVMSMREPWRENGGRVAVTMTAATFFGLKSSPRMLMPSRSSMPMIDCSVKGEFERLSPLPLRPTTRP